MSVRTIAGVAVTTAALAGLTAGAASARPDYQFDAGAATPAAAATSGTATAQPAAAPIEVSSPVVEGGHDGAGAGTITVLAVAGGTLLVGAAGGFGGGRVVARRHALRP